MKIIKNTDRWSYNMEGEGRDCTTPVYFFCRFCTLRTLFAGDYDSMVCGWRLSLNLSINDWTEIDINHEDEYRGENN